MYPNYEISDYLEQLNKLNVIHVYSQLTDKPQKVL